MRNESSKRNFILQILILFFSMDSIAKDYYLKNKKWFSLQPSKIIEIRINEKNLNLNDKIEEIYKYYLKKPHDFYFLPKRLVSEDKMACPKLFKKGYLDLKEDGHLLSLTEDINWSINPFNDRNWQYEFHTLKFLECLRNGYRAYHDKWYIERMKQIIEDWWKDNFTSKYPSEEFSWYNHTIPNRLEEIIKSFEFVRRTPYMDKEFLRAALEAIYIHARILSEEKLLFMFHHNHGLVQAFVLFETALLFPEYIDAKKWKKVAKERLREEIDFALTDEGIHKENSPGYHVWVSPLIYNMNLFSVHYTGNPIVENYKELAEKGLYFTSIIMDKNEKLPEIGDTLKNSSVKLKYRGIKNIGSYQVYKNIASKKSDGSVPKKKFFYFKKSGYFIYHDYLKKDSIKLIQKCSFLAPGHRHDDDGNILLTAYGEEWLIDAGIYGYKYDQYRKYVTSASAHNVSYPLEYAEIYLSDRYLEKQLAKRYNNFLDNWGFVKMDKNETICVSHMYDNYKYTRTLRLTNETSFDIVDTLTQDNNSSNSRVFLTNFRFPDDKHIYVDKNRSSIVVLGRDKRHAMKIDNIKGVHGFNLLYGESSIIKSLTTDTWQKVKPIQTVVFFNKGKSFKASFHVEFLQNPDLSQYTSMKHKKNILKEYTDKFKIIEDHDRITFKLNKDDKNLLAAFYLYKDSKVIQKKWYSTDFSFTFSKKKFGPGKYRLQYFLLSPSALKKKNYGQKESGFSPFVKVK